MPKFVSRIIALVLVPCLAFGANSEILESQALALETTLPAQPPTLTSEKVAREAAALSHGALPARHSPHNDGKWVRAGARVGGFLGDYRKELAFAAIGVVVIYFLHRYFFDDPREMPLPVRLWHRLYRSTIDRVKAAVKALKPENVQENFIGQTGSHSEALPRAA
jgi:hypothetical protein